MCAWWKSANPFDNGRVPVTPDDGRPNPPEITIHSYASPSLAAKLSGSSAASFSGSPSSKPETQIITTRTVGKLNSSGAYSYLVYGDVSDFLYDTRLFGFMPYEMAEVPSIGTHKSGYDLWTDLETRLAVAEPCGFSGVDGLTGVHSTVAVSFADFASCAATRGSLSISYLTVSSALSYSTAYATGNALDYCAVTSWRVSAAVESVVDTSQLFGTLAIWSAQGEHTAAIVGAEFSSSPVSYATGGTHEIGFLFALLASNDSTVAGSGYVTDGAQITHEFSSPAAVSYVVYSESLFALSARLAHSGVAVAGAAQCVVAIAGEGVQMLLRETCAVETALSASLTVVNYCSGGAVIVISEATGGIAHRVCAAHTYTEDALFGVLLSPAGHVLPDHGHLSDVYTVEHTAGVVFEANTELVVQTCAEFYTHSSQELTSTYIGSLLTHTDSATSFLSDTYVEALGVLCGSLTNSNASTFTGTSISLVAVAHASTSGYAPVADVAAPESAYLSVCAGVLLPALGLSGVSAVMGGVPATASSTAWAESLISCVLAGVSEMSFAGDALTVASAARLVAASLSDSVWADSSCSGIWEAGASGGTVSFISDRLDGGEAVNAVTSAFYPLAAHSEDSLFGTLSVSDRVATIHISGALSVSDVWGIHAGDACGVGGRVLIAFTRDDIYAPMYKLLGPTVYRKDRYTIYKMSAGFSRDVSSLPLDVSMGYFSCLNRSVTPFSATGIDAVSTTENAPLLIPQLNCDFGYTVSVADQIMGGTDKEFNRIPPRSAVEWRGVMFDVDLPTTEHDPYLRPFPNADFLSGYELPPVLLGEFISGGVANSMPHVMDAASADAYGFSSLDSPLAPAYGSLPHYEEWVITTLAGGGLEFTGVTVETVGMTRDTAMSAFAQCVDMPLPLFTLPCIVGHHSREYLGNVVTVGWSESPFASPAIYSEPFAGYQAVGAVALRSDTPFSALLVDNALVSESSVLLPVYTGDVAALSGLLTGIPVQCVRKEQVWPALVLGGVYVGTDSVLTPHAAHMVANLADTGQLLATEDSTLFSYHSFTALALDGHECARLLSDPILVSAATGVWQHAAVELPNISLTLANVGWSSQSFPAVYADTFPVAAYDVLTPLLLGCAYPSEDTLAAAFTAPLGSVFTADSLNTFYADYIVVGDRDVPTYLTPTSKQPVVFASTYSPPLSYRKLQSALLHSGRLYKDIYVSTIQVPYPQAWADEYSVGGLAKCAHMPHVSNATLLSEDSVRSAVDYTYADAWLWWDGEVTALDSAAVGSAGLVHFGGQAFSFVGDVGVDLPTVGDGYVAHWLEEAAELSGLLTLATSGDAAMSFYGIVQTAVVGCTSAMPIAPATSASTWAVSQEFPLTAASFGMQVSGSTLELWAVEDFHSALYSPAVVCVEELFTPDLDAAGMPSYGSTQAAEASQSGSAPTWSDSAYYVEHAAGVMATDGQVVYMGAAHISAYTSSLSALFILGEDYLSVAGTETYSLRMFGTARHANYVDTQAALHGILAVGEPATTLSGSIVSALNYTHSEVAEHSYVFSVGLSEYGAAAELAMVGSAEWAGATVHSAYAESAALLVPSVVGTASPVDGYGAALSLSPALTYPAADMYVTYAAADGVAPIAVDTVAVLHVEPASLSVDFGAISSGWLSSVGAASSLSGFITILGHDYLAVGGAESYEVRMQSLAYRVSAHAAGLHASRLSLSSSVSLEGAVADACAALGDVLSPAPGSFLWDGVAHCTASLSTDFAVAVLGSLEVPVVAESAHFNPIVTDSVTAVDVIIGLISCGGGSVPLPGVTIDFPTDGFLPDFHPPDPGGGRKFRQHLAYRHRPTAGVRLWYVYKDMLGIVEDIGSGRPPIGILDSIETVPLNMYVIGGPILAAADIGNVHATTDYDYQVLFTFYWNGKALDWPHVVEATGALFTLEPSVVLAGTTVSPEAKHTEDRYSIAGLPALSIGFDGSYDIQRVSGSSFDGFSNWYTGFVGEHSTPELSLTPSATLSAADVVVGHSYNFGRATAYIDGADNLSIGHAAPYSLSFFGSTSWDNKSAQRTAGSGSHIHGPVSADGVSITGVVTEVGYSNVSTSGAVHIYGHDALSVGGMSPYALSYDGAGNGVCGSFTWTAFATSEQVAASLYMGAAPLMLAASEQVSTSASDASPYVALPHGVSVAVGYAALNTMLPAMALDGAALDPTTGISLFGSTTSIYGTSALTIGATSEYLMACSFVSGVAKDFAAPASAQTVATLSVDANVLLQACVSAAVWAADTCAIFASDVDAFTVEPLAVELSSLSGMGLHAVAVDTYHTADTSALMILTGDKLTSGFSAQALLLFNSDLAWESVPAHIVDTATAVYSVAASNPDIFATTANFDEGVSVGTALVFAPDDVTVVFEETATFAYSPAISFIGTVSEGYDAVSYDSRAWEAATHSPVYAEHIATSLGMGAAITMSGAAHDVRYSAWEFSTLSSTESAHAATNEAVKLSLDPAIMFGGIATEGVGGSVPYLLDVFVLVSGASDITTGSSGEYALSARYMASGVRIPYTAFTSDNTIAALTMIDASPYIKAAEVAVLSADGWDTSLLKPLLTSAVEAIAACFSLDAGNPYLEAAESVAISTGGYASAGPLPKPVYYIRTPAQYIYQDGASAFLKQPFSLYKGNYGARFNYADGVGHAVEHLASLFDCSHSLLNLSAADLSPVTGYGAVDRDRDDFYTFHWNHYKLLDKVAHYSDGQDGKLSLDVAVSLPGAVLDTIPALTVRGIAAGLIVGSPTLSVGGSDYYTALLTESNHPSAGVPTSDFVLRAHFADGLAGTLDTMSGAVPTPGNEVIVGYTLADFLHGANVVGGTFVDQTITAYSCGGRHFQSVMPLCADALNTVEFAVSFLFSAGDVLTFFGVDHETAALSTDTGIALLAHAQDTYSVYASAACLVENTAWADVSVEAGLSTHAVLSFPGAVQEAVYTYTHMLFSEIADNTVVSCVTTTAEFCSTLYSVAPMRGALSNVEYTNQWPEGKSAYLFTHVVHVEHLVGCTGVWSATPLLGWGSLITAIAGSGAPNLTYEAYTAAVNVALSPAGCTGVWSATPLLGWGSLITAIAGSGAPNLTYEAYAAAVNVALSPAATIECSCHFNGAFSAEVQSTAPVVSSGAAVFLLAASAATADDVLLGQFCGFGGFDSRPDGCSAIGTAIGGVEALLPDTFGVEFVRSCAHTVSHVFPTEAYTTSIQTFTGATSDLRATYSKPLASSHTTSEAHATDMGFVKLTATHFWHCAMYADELNAVIPTWPYPRLVFIPVIPDMDFWFDHEEEDSKFQLAFIF